MEDLNSRAKPKKDTLSASQKKQVLDKTQRVIQQASKIYKQDFNEIEIKFDLTGRNVGMYVVKYRQRYIRYNQYVFARYYDDCLQQTVVHEVAHYICDCLYGLRKVRPHGVEWQSIMQALGAEPTVRCHYDLSEMPTKTYRQFDYQCSCRQHQLSSIRHNKVLRGKARYRCRNCNDELQIINVS